MKNFVIKYEKYCLALVQKILEDENCAEPVAIENEGKEILAGAFYHSKGGQILHFLPSPVSCKAWLENHFRNNPTKEIFSIIGEKKGTEQIQNAIYKTLGELQDFSWEYDLMEWKDEIFSGNEFSQNAQFLKANLTDEKIFGEILSLQLNYEREEVYYKENQENAKFTELTLRKNIKNGKVYILKDKNGQIVSKLSVNAEGKNYVQIGGVFTKKEERKKGFGKMIVEEFLKLQKENNKKTVLFVKKENFPAQKLYASLGFKKISDFKIVYY